MPSMPPPARPISVRVADGIDALTGLIGRAAAWLVVAAVLIAAYNAIARYAGRFLGVQLSSNAYIELQWYLFSLLFLLGAAYTLREDAHVRVDVLYGRLPERARALIDIVGTSLLLVPFCLFVVWVSLPVVQASWRVREGSPDPGGLPRYPLKMMIIVCFVLLLLQGGAGLIRQVRALRASHGAGSDTGPGAPGA
jgi:TRAP-type mannitol/chloroaromatic compound transport system permease small subunit